MQICIANALTRIAQVRVRTANTMGPIGLTMQSLPVLRAMRKPHRVTLTISDKTYNQLIAVSGSEGRSLSNLGAYLLELALDEREKRTALGL